MKRYFSIGCSSTPIRTESVEGICQTDFSVQEFRKSISATKNSGSSAYGSLSLMTFSFVTPTTSFGRENKISLLEYVRSQVRNKNAATEIRFASASSQKEA